MVTTFVVFCLWAGCVALALSFFRGAKRLNGKPYVDDYAQTEDELWDRRVK